MSRTISVELDSDFLIELFCNRLADKWLKTRSGEEYELWEQLYKNDVENGEFDNAYIDVNDIVDEDYVTYIDCVDRNQCFEEYGFDPEEDPDGRVRVTNGHLYLINTVV